MHLFSAEVNSNLCAPSPCGPNSRCRIVNQQAICSCIEGYLGSPPSCRPECTSDSECEFDKSCQNQKCRDPCPGTCGHRAKCNIHNHIPICVCPPGHTGNPFQQCLVIKEPVESEIDIKNPCIPTPCGPNSQCKISGNSYICLCLPGFEGAPPNCKPECISNAECASNLACINQKCKNPCPGLCGKNAECRVISHVPQCVCNFGYNGDPFTLCVEAIKTAEVVEPCNPSPCGVNAECRAKNNAAACVCLPDFFGDPYQGCRPECVINSDCPSNKACIQRHCRDPCPGVCGQNAECYVRSHLPNCNCLPGFSGDPFFYCSAIQQPVKDKTQEPCQPNPCGPNSKCDNRNGQPICSCVEDYIGTPPMCRPECVLNSECPSNNACLNKKCVNPCVGICGSNAVCSVRNHSPICACETGFTGDPLMNCYPIKSIVPIKEKDLCIPSPCGPFSQCREINGKSACSCLPSYVGSPPYCKPECLVNSECQSNLACINEKCKDPCPGSCGVNAKCLVTDHTPSCSCPSDKTGNPFHKCFAIEPIQEIPIEQDPCHPSPCGMNTICNAGVCSCISNYIGNPNIGCRPECVLNSDCPSNRACLNEKCKDPCVEKCGTNSICETINHIAFCKCPKNMSGNPFISCQIVERPIVSENPCNPSPCGLNSRCQNINNQPVCSCVLGYFGSPPNCRPECYTNSDCQQINECVNNKCVDPCPGRCGLNAICQVVQHKAVCECSHGYTGNPNSYCRVIERPLPSVIETDPCRPSPCGPNAYCKNINNKAECSCLSNYIGVPPNCRPECTKNDDCSNNLACINQKCEDPCPGSCGENAQCIVTVHIPNCICNIGLIGDPFFKCYKKAQPPKPVEENPCEPSPCGSNAMCRIRGQNYICECVRDYIGNPYEGCRPECIGNSECPSNKACIRYKCKDPCPGTCGYNALCTVTNHIPICTCPPELTGNAFRSCEAIRRNDTILEKPINPCHPSPCGLNSICRVLNQNVICECIPGYYGDPTGQGCTPECTLSSDCTKDKTCVNFKCIDPCPGACGYGAQCQTINHNPICSCPSPSIGNPFVECHPPEPKDLCNPSPCKTNGVCRIVNNLATCFYPECISNDDCPRDKSCSNQKCQDPCIHACGINAICNAVNHKSVCSCPSGYLGSAYDKCYPQMEPIPPRVECTQDSDCPNDKSCINQQCRNPCIESPRICGENAKCYVQNHRPLCVCNEGFTGNANSYCYVIGCRNDDDCPATESCINQKCWDSCSYIQCGRNAICKTDFNHKARCHCLEGYRGNPLIHCDRPECVNDSDCPFNLACLNERCQDPCKCGEGAECRVSNHIAQCRCLPGYTGDPQIKCNLLPKEVTECLIDADCPRRLACFEGKCKNPCDETHPCGANAKCVVVDTLPLRTMVCQCEPNYVGNADLGCRKEITKEPGCSKHEDCPDSEVCRSGVCRNPCITNSPCAKTAECSAKNHRAVCKCPQNLQGDPFVNCYTPSLITPECTTDADCSPTMACFNHRCENPCAEANPCAGNAECRVHQNRALCYCPAGWGGDPKNQCFKPECAINSDCPYDKACINEKCVNPCTYGSVRCGTGAKCKPENHQATCECPIGTQGNPFSACITGKCQYNDDCADHEACDRLNRICKAVCFAGACANLASCYGRNHQPLCECKPGTTGNPYVECTQSRQPALPEPECNTDIDCSSHLACINRKCSDPCALSNVCSPQQTCTVLETTPLRTLICTCPQDTITDNSRNCIPIKFDEGCRSNSDCTDPEICQRGQCIEACRLESCGINALCSSKNHYAHCSCPRGYTGNPRIECLPSKTKPTVAAPECTRNDDCPNDRKCVNEICLNPCVLPKTCGVAAYCHVELHQPICRCPAGYNGVPEISCRPLEPTLLECESNSDCSLTNSCINGHCIDPCNCGSNAECFVRNHHPVCYCRPGYSGNPQNGCVPVGCQADDDCSLDKQCINQECINPCAINDPCAINAECYGRNHRATCRCPAGLEGDPFKRCDRVECHSDYDCPLNQGCINSHCINLCQERNPCARNANCFVLNHAAICKCPEHLPLGNPFAYCEEQPPPPQQVAECTTDGECPSKQACINEKCVNPCKELQPCTQSAHCFVLDSVPVRTMVCECPEHFIPDNNGECSPIKTALTLGCSSNDECPNNEACINRQCRNPCNCGTNAICLVQNHRATCSCEDGHEGNPYSYCKTVGCRIDNECESGKACINGNCVNPCLITESCGKNAECYVQNNKAECRCLNGYRGNPYEGCIIIGCRTNTDCPSEKTCVNAQCVNPCIYNNPCAPHSECRPQNHIAICRCLLGYIGNPYIDCKKEVLPECVYDSDCPSRLACIENKCKNPCLILEPCNRPARCEVTPTSPLRTMICVCPDGYISSGSGTCKPTTPVKAVGCLADSDCPEDRTCVNGICRNPCNCGINAECRIKDHKPVCSCRQGFEGNAEFECVKVGCISNDECLITHSCINRQCVPACSTDRGICGKFAECIGTNHRAVCECVPGFEGNPRQSCLPVGCRSNSECPSEKACINNKCQNPCEVTAVCAQDEICKVYNHKAQCTCPPGFIGTLKNGCMPEEPEAICKYDGDCPSKEACFRGECLNPCSETQPCGVNTECRVLDTAPIRTMICECLPGYQGNAAVQCDKMSICHIEKGFVRDVDGRCVCPPGAALDEYDYCVPCDKEKGYRIDENGHCACALEKGFIIDERGRCICPLEHGYYLNEKLECIRRTDNECESNSDCPDNRSCKNRLCIDPCIERNCGNNALCNTTNHRPICTPINTNITFRTDFPRPDMVVSCLADGVQVEIHITEPGFNGVLYVKGHSKEEECRRVVNLSGDSVPRTEVFKVNFGSCGLIHVNGVASFILVIQKHPKLVTYKAQAYNIKCVYQTGEKNVTLGFNVSMLTTAGTIANTGPPPICQMRIVTHNGEEISSAEIGDNLVLQVDVEPATIYGGFARSCIAKTMEDNVENEYIVTDENGCATDPTIFGEWEYNPETNSLLASFNAFKFPSSDNIRFQCNIRVCFGKCQPVNCRGYNAFGRRRRRQIESEDINLSSQSNNSQATSASGVGIEGQLREEITIQSNAILTFEKREYSDSNIKPAAQRVEDICVSMVGLIIALVLTALLALVAVAVAVSCWLMAYRRRPKAVGPLPHPPEFPNPLFTNPDAIPEPTPDYLS